MLKEWINDCRIILEKNPSFRREYFPQADSPADRTRPLPLADRFEIMLIKQPMTSWMLFLQGNLDYQALDKDNADLAGGGELLGPPQVDVGHIGMIVNGAVPSAEAQIA